MKLISIVSLLAMGIIAMPTENLEATTEVADIADIADIEATTDITENIDTTSDASRAQASCERKDYGIVFHYDVRASGVKDGSAVCANLHNALRAQNCAPTTKSCNVDQSDNLHWWWNDSRVCSKQKVEHAWWQVTGNKYGTIKC